MKNYKSITILGFILSLIPLGIYGMWIYACTQTESQPESVSLFHSYFPSYLQGRYNTIYLGLLVAICSLGIGLYAIAKTKGLWWYINVLTIISASLMALLHLFGLM